MALDPREANRRAWLHLTNLQYGEAVGSTGVNTVTGPSPPAGKTWIVFAASIEHSALLTLQLWIEATVGSDTIPVTSATSLAVNLPAALDRPLVVTGPLVGRSGANPTAGALTLRFSYVEIDAADDLYLPPFLIS